MPFPTLSASFDPIIEFGPGLQRFGLPDPKLQTMCFVSGFTSITLPLNLSVISTFPFWLKPDGAAVAALTVTESAKKADKIRREPTTTKVAVANLARASPRVLLTFLSI